MQASEQGSGGQEDSYDSFFWDILTFSVISVMLELFSYWLYVTYTIRKQRFNFCCLREKKRSAGLGGPQEDRIGVERKVTPGKAHESQEPLQEGGSGPSFGQEGKSSKTCDSEKEADIWGVK